MGWIRAEWLGLAENSDGQLNFQFFGSCDVHGLCMNMAQKKRQYFDLDRMNSCLTVPQEEVLVAYDEANLQLFADLINDDELDINHEYVERNCSTLLQLCVASGQVEFVKEVLRRRDVNPNVPHKILKKYPLHQAVEDGNVALVDLLLRAGSDINAKMENGNMPLHLAAVRSAAKWIKDDTLAKEEMQRNFILITKILLSVPGINIDSKNNIGVTPLFFAVDKGSEAVAKELLLMKACVNVEIDGETIEEKISEKMPTVLEGIDLALNRRNNDAIENKLFHLLYYENYDPGKFVEAWREAESNNNRVNVDADNGTYTFLQYCADQGLEDIVRFLLHEKGASPNKMCANYLIPPIVLAGHHGYYKVISVFKELALNSKGYVNFAAKDKIKSENVLHKVIKGESKSAVNSHLRDYDRCLDILLEDRPSFRRMVLPSVNATDQMGNTPLHIAAQLGKESAVRKLLRCEANIGIKNKRMETPVTFISPSVMEEFLDECLQDHGLITDDTFQLTFKYSFLGPPLNIHPRKSSQLSLDETDALEFKGGLFEDGDGFDGDQGQDLPEAEPLWYLSQSMDHRRLLAHPVITSFLCLKWRRIRPYYYVNLMAYLLFVACLTAYLLITNLDDGEESLNGTNSGLRVTTLILAVILSTRECFQALVSPRRYIFNLENIMEVTMLAITISLTHEQMTTSQLHRNLAAAAILLAWAEMFLMFGRHPKMSNFIKMFSSVSLKFMVFLMWYICIIVAFGLAFFLILSKGANDHFKDPEKSLMKTTVMSLTGELEFEGVDFGEEWSLYGKAIYLFYIFFIMLVLVNLLNGLAVSDIAVIQKEAEILSYVSRVELISFIESMLLGDPFHFLTNWPPFAWGQKLPSCDCFKSLYKIGPFRWVLSKVMGTTLLFSEGLVDKQAVFYPNKSKQEQSSLPGPNGSSVNRKLAMDNLILDDDIIEAAKALLVKRNESKELTMLSSKLKQIEKSMMLMNKQQNYLIEMMSNMTTK